MAAQSTLASKEVIVTEADFDQLKALLDSRQYRATHPVSLMVLKEDLDRSRVVPPAEVPRGVVTMRSRVRVRDLADDEIDTYTLVYPDEADVNEGKVSVLAPIGMALLGSPAGETIRFEAPAGKRRLKIERVLYQPEAAGDFHL